ncbi:MAG: SET domain-containing protein-lysine N-methyltransferase [Flavitalea sp.]
MFMIAPYLRILPAKNMGQGVFTTEDIPAKKVIEISPVLVMSYDERVALDKVKLHDYIFEWNSSQKQCCVAWGYVSIYNHSYESNCEYEIRILTMRPIKSGEQLFINYNGTFNNKKPLWFDAI